MSVLLMFETKQGDVALEKNSRIVVGGYLVRIAAGTSVPDWDLCCFPQSFSDKSR